jgi:hypothetical protein
MKRVSGTFTMHAFGNLIQVVELNPASGTFTTSYQYDYLNHLTHLTMPRQTGTQTRTFNYGNPPGARLLQRDESGDGHGDVRVQRRWDARDEDGREKVSRFSTVMMGTGG